MIWLEESPNRLENRIIVAESSHFRRLNERHRLLEAEFHTLRAPQCWIFEPKKNACYRSPKPPSSRRFDARGAYTLIVLDATAAAVGHSGEEGFDGMQKAFGAHDPCIAKRQMDMYYAHDRLEADARVEVTFHDIHQGLKRV